MVREGGRGVVTHLELLKSLSPCRSHEEERVAVVDLSDRLLPFRFHVQSEERGA